MAACFTTHVFQPRFHGGHQECFLHFCIQSVNDGCWCACGCHEASSVSAEMSSIMRILVMSLRSADEMGVTLNKLCMLVQTLSKSAPTLSPLISSARRSCGATIA